MTTTIVFKFGNNYTFDKFDYTVAMRAATAEEILLLKNANRSHLDIPRPEENSHLKIFASFENALHEFNAHNNYLENQKRYQKIKNQKIHNTKELQKYLSTDFSQAYRLFAKNIRFYTHDSKPNPMMILREHEIDEIEKNYYSEVNAFIYEMTPEEKEEYFKYYRKRANDKTDCKKMISELYSDYHDKYGRYILYYYKPHKFIIDTNNAINKNYIYLFPGNNSKIGIIKKHEIINIDNFVCSPEDKSFITYEPVLAVSGEILEKVQMEEK